MAAGRRIADNDGWLVRDAWTDIQTQHGNHVAPAIAVRTRSTPRPIDGTLRNSPCHQNRHHQAPQPLWTSKPGADYVRGDHGEDASRAFQSPRVQTGPWLQWLGLQLAVPELDSDSPASSLTACSELL